MAVLSLTVYNNYGSLLHLFRDKAKYWSKIVIFPYPVASDAPVVVGPRWNIAIPFGVEKLEFWATRVPVVKKL